MLIFSIVTAAIAPGLSLLTFLYLKDKYEAEPIYMVARMFILGALIVIPIMVLQRGVTIIFGHDIYSTSFIQSALIEELLKWFVLYHVIYNHTEFDEPYDGILYAGAISLGFATVENLMYSFFMPSDFSSMLLRSLLPVSGHALFGVLMGYYLGRAKFTNKNNKRVLICMSLFVPYILHGTYDWIILKFENDWLLLIIPFMLMLWIIGLKKVKSAHLKSPFRYVRGKDNIKL